MNDEIDIWTLSEDAVSATMQDSFANALSSGEREKAARYRRPGDRLRSVAARGLLRNALSYHAGHSVAPAAWEIEVTEKGRPIVVGPRSFSVSVTHTPGLIAVAVAADPDVDVGIDAECIQRRTDFDQITRRWYTPSEIAELVELADDARRQRFFRYWVLKEAYSKARGLGLAIGLDRVRFIEPYGSIVVLEDESEVAGWSFEVRETDGDFVVGVAASRPRATLRWSAYAAR